MKNNSGEIKSAESMIESKGHGSTEREARTNPTNVEEALQLDESRLDALFHLIQMEESPLQEIVDFALEEGVKLTKSKLGYLAFMNETESVLTMYAWSHDALAECAVKEKCLVFPVQETGLWGEAVRTRRAVITNDYSAPNPAKRGLPEGHVPIFRHMNVPIFEGKKIVAVAGVSNKTAPYDDSDIRQLTLIMDGMWKIIQRKRASEVLKSSEMRYRALAEASHDMILIFDGYDTIQYANSYAARLFKLTAEAMVGRSRTEFFQDDAGERQGRSIREVFETGQPVYIENKVLVGQRETWLGTWLVPMKNDAGVVTSVLGTSRDNTERKQAEAVLRVQGAALEAAANGIVITDAQGAIVWVNTAFTHLTGFFAEEVIGHTPRLLKSGRQSPEFYKQLWSSISSGNVWRGEMTNRRKDGSFYTEEMTITPVRDSQGGISHYIAIKQDVTHRHNMEQELRLSRKRFQLIFDSSPAAIGISTLVDDRFIDINLSFLRMFGYERQDVVGHTAAELGLWVKREEREGLIQKLETEKSAHNLEVHFRAKSGQTRDVLLSVETIQVGLEACQIFIINDISELKRLEAQLRQSQKMESIGTLAGGVAHDFNNILTVIQGHSNLAILEDDLSVRCRESIEQIILASERAANLTRQLLTFSRKQPMQLRVLGLNDVIINLTKMLRRIIGEDITLECHYAPQLPPIKADAGMIEQILLNLAVNARDAMPQGGRLQVTTHLELLDMGKLKRPLNAPETNYLCMSIRDSGCGIPPEVLPRIFEPFFTTKEANKGTGLGLATVHGIVEQHRGWIEVDSQLQKGTEFRIFLPAQDELAVPEHVSVRDAVRGGKETILVVEDEPELSRLCHDVLCHYGYHVREASSGVEAIQKWGNHVHEMDLLLTDIIMPNGVNGHQLAEAFRTKKPLLKVLFTSGYNADAAGFGLLKERPDNYLQKPYSPSVLARAVRQCLDASASS